MLAPMTDGQPFFSRIERTGSHVASIDAVAEGRADLCAVDAVTPALLARHEPGRLRGTRVLEYSPRAPGLPYVAGPRVAAIERERMQAAVHAALADADLAPVRDQLLIAGAEDLPLGAYGEIVAMEREAMAMGYAEVR